MRLGFYESWLSPESLRGGTVGLAPILAILSFLRMEGESYDRVTMRAGECVAEWTVDAMPWFHRRLIRSMPAPIRVRLLLRLARRAVRDTYRSTRATARVRRGTATMELHETIFCTVRERTTQPLCRFYAAVVTRFMTLFELDLTATMVACRGTGASDCVLTMSVSGRPSNEGQEPA